MRSHAVSAYATVLSPTLLCASAHLFAPHMPIAPAVSRTGSIIAHANDVSTLLTMIAAFAQTAAAAHLHAQSAVATLARASEVLMQAANATRSDASCWSVRDIVFCFRDVLAPSDTKFLWQVQMAYSLMRRRTRCSPVAQRCRHHGRAEAMCATYSRRQRVLGRGL